MAWHDQQYLFYNLLYFILFCNLFFDVQLSYSFRMHHLSWSFCNHFGIFIVAMQIAIPFV